jgi:hypothetical protein
MNSNNGEQQHTSSVDAIPLSSSDSNGIGVSQWETAIWVDDGGASRVVKPSLPVFSLVSESPCVSVSAKGDTSSILSSMSSVKSGSGAMAPNLPPVSLATDDDVKDACIMLLLAFNSVGIV